MQAEPPQELLPVKGNGFFFVMIPVIFDSETYLLVIHLSNAVVADGDRVDILSMLS